MVMDQLVSKREASKAYNAAYRLANKDLLSDKAKARYAENRDARLSAVKEYRAANIELVRARDSVRNKTESRRAKARQVYARDPSKAIAYQAERQAANGDHVRSLRKTRRDANPEIHRSQIANRRAARLERCAGWDRELTDLVVLESADLARKREAVTGLKWHVDHVVPLQGKKVSGLHVWNNLAVIPAVDNLRKNNKFETA